MTTRANFYVDQGADFITTLELETSEGTEYPVTNNEFYCQVRKVFSSRVVIDVDVEIIPNGVSNDLSLTITAEKTMELEPGKYQYDVIMRDTEQGSITKILEGLMFVIPSITRIQED